jgi:hypothetical protein
MKNLILKNGTKTIEFCGTIKGEEIEVEIEDDMNDLYAWTWLNKQDLIVLSKHINNLIKEMSF